MATKYDNQRAKRVPPHVALRVLRDVSGLTLDQVCARASEHLGGDSALTRGALSAIELGHRGPSLQVLAALEYAYGIEAGSISTSYLPRQREQVPA